MLMMMMTLLGMGVSDWEGTPVAPQKTTTAAAASPEQSTIDGFMAPTEQHLALINSCSPIRRAALEKTRLVLFSFLLLHTIKSNQEERRQLLSLSLTYFSFPVPSALSLLYLLPPQRHCLSFAYERDFYSNYCKNIGNRTAAEKKSFIDIYSKKTCINSLLRMQIFHC